MINLDEIKHYIKHNVENQKPPHSLIEKYRKAVGVYNNSQLLSERTILENCNKGVVFISDRPNYFFLRMSIALRKRGIVTTLITRWGVEACQTKFFSSILLYNRISELQLLKVCENATLYIQSWVGWNFLPVFIHLFFSGKIYCNINDISNILFDDVENLRLLGLSPADVEMDLLCEKYLLKKCSYVTTSYQEKSLELIKNKIGSNGKSNILTFPCYPECTFFYRNSRKFSKPAHLFYAGMLPSDDKPDRVFGDAKMHKIIPILLKKQLSVTIFNNPQTIRLDNPNELSVKYPFFSRLADNNPNFVLKMGCGPWELKQYAGKFHFGFIIYDYDNQLLISKNHYENFIPTKMFTYVEMGLPLIVIDKLKAAADFVKKYGIGIVVSKNELKNIEGLLDVSQESYDELCLNIQTCRHKINMDTMINELGFLFYDP